MSDDEEELKLISIKSNNDKIQIEEHKNEELSNENIIDNNEIIEFYDKEEEEEEEDKVFVDENYSSSDDSEICELAPRICMINSGVGTIELDNNISPSPQDIVVLQEIVDDLSKDQDDVISRPRSEEVKLFIVYLKP